MNTISSLPCTSKHPMYCTREELARLYKKSRSQFPAQALINSPHLEIMDNVNWAFDPSSMTIWNDRYWKGFYPADYDFANIILMYGFGFYKRFWPDKDDKGQVRGQKVKGETHPFNTSIHAANQATDMDLPERGKVIYIKYSDFPFNNFDDLLKIVDRDTVLGEAFVSLRSPGRGISVFHFVLSRRYSTDFMTQADCRFIFQFKSKEVAAEDALGVWDLKLVSNAAHTPPILRLEFFGQESHLSARIIQIGNLPDASQIRSLSEKQAHALHLPEKIESGLIRSAGKGLMLGILEEPDNPLFQAILGSRGFVTRGKEGLMLPYILKRVK